MIKDVIFDFDGTLSDTYPIFTEALLEILRDRGIPADYDTAYSKLKIMLSAAYEYYGLPHDIGKEFNIVHNRLALEKQQSMEGAREILEYIAGNGGRNYVFTHSGKIVTDLMDKWGLSKYVTDMVDATVKIRRKPDPEGVLILLGRNGIDPDEALIVGDRNIDIDSGHNGGIRGCLFDPGHFVPETSAEWRIEKLTDLKNIVLR